MGASAISMLILGERFVRPFATDPTVIAIVMTLLPVAAVFQVADGVQAVAFGVLRGVGDTRIPALMNIVAYWVVGLPIGWWVGLQVTGSPSGVWTGLVVGLVVVAALMLARMGWVSRRPIRRVEVDPAA